MSKTLTQIAQELKDANKKVQLIYAFNGTGKTRLSKEFKKLINGVDENDEEIKPEKRKVLYYNAYTEDLFYWDNDLENDEEPVLKMHSNTFTDWLIGEQGQEGNIETILKNYTNDKLSCDFLSENKEIKKDEKKEIIKTFTGVKFSFKKGDETNTENIKISKGEESNFIWSVFYSLFKLVISILDTEDVSLRDTDEYNDLEYVFIDDPVSSLDENHLIELAVDLAKLIKSSENQKLRFVITTHNPLFYNILYNEFSNDFSKKMPNGKTKKTYKKEMSKKSRLVKNLDGRFELQDSNDHPFSYHLFLLKELKDAIKNDQLKKYHFNFLRNILEKTSTFLGHKRWEKLLEEVDGQPDPFANRILNLSSHSAHAGEEVSLIKDEDKDKLKKIVEFLTKKYCFHEEE